MRELSKWRRNQRNDDFHYTTGIFHTLYTEAIFIGLIVAILFFTGCASTGVSTAPEYNVYGIKSYIVDRWNLKYYARGVYDMNRNDKVDVGIDMLFFTKNPEEKGGAHIWYLHNISYWEVDGDEIALAISPYPVKIAVDNDNDGLPDVTYYAKEGIVHDGLVSFDRDFAIDNKIGE